MRNLDGERTGTGLMEAIRGSVSVMKCVLCLVAQSCPTLCDSLDCDQAPLSMGFSRQKYWSGLPCPPPGDLPNPGIEPRSPALQVDSLPSEPPGKLGSITCNEIVLMIIVKLGHMLPIGARTTELHLMLGMCS